MNSAPKGKNVIGVIPLSGRKDIFGFPWPDYLQPLREGMLAVERSIYECAYAGCDSIWIVVNDDTAPLLKKRIGDYVMDPMYFKEKDFVRKKHLHEKWIPIYYTPVSPKDRDRRDSLGWSVLHGALTSFVVASKISRWVRPTKYFVSFPFGIYDASFIEQYRQVIRGKQSFFLSHKGQTVRDGKYLSFTFQPEDWIKYKRNIKHQCTGGDKNLPISERWSSRFFSLDKIFNCGNIVVDKIFEVDNYYHLDDWESLKDFYSSDTIIKRPSRLFMKPYFINKPETR